MNANEKQPVAPGKQKETAEMIHEPISNSMTISNEAVKMLVSPSAVKAAELEIIANHLRALKECTAPLGIFVQKAINEALEDYRNATSRG